MSLRGERAPFVQECLAEPRIDGERPAQHLDGAGVRELDVLGVPEIGEERAREHALEEIPSARHEPRRLGPGPVCRTLSQALVAYPAIGEIGSIR